jgi:hypothetical protein
MAYGNALLLIISIAIIAGGAYLIIDGVIWSAMPFNLAVAGVTIGTLGAYILWKDFIAPLLVIKGER